MHFLFRYIFIVAMPVSLALRVLTSVFALFAFSILFHQIDFHGSSMMNHSNSLERCSLSGSNHDQSSSSTPSYVWKAVGHTPDEQTRLRDLSIVIAAWPAHAEDNVPTVPCLSADGHLLLLSASASQVRYGASVTFILVYPSDVKNVLPQTRESQPLSAHSLSLWCIFDDGSVTPAYSYDSRYGNDRASLLDCPLSPFAQDQLWRDHRTLRVYLASMTDRLQNAPIAKAYVSVPTPPSLPLNSSQQVLTLCTSPLHNGAEYLMQWIFFHLLVGFRKFVVYNTTDTHQRLAPLITLINGKYPNLVDVVQWNFSTLALTDVMSTRYFQTEALHDCLIRYGDQSEWLGMLDLDEYVVPQPPYTTVLQYLHEQFARRIVGSVNLWSHFFCARSTDKYSNGENETRRLVIERFLLRAPDRHKGGREKYLYRPRFVQYLSIHHQIVGLSKEEPSANSIMLAHYASMTHLRTAPGCSPAQYVNDTTVRDRFSKQLTKVIEELL